MLADVLRKKEGFQGQKAISIPGKILSGQCANNNIISSLYITDIGYYPNARFHYCERKHGIDQHILIYCVKGCGEVSIAEIKYAIDAGDFCIIPAKIAHTYIADEKNPWTIYWVHFRGSIADSITKLILKQQNGYKGFIHFNENRINIFNEIYSHLERGYRTDHLVYSNMCLWHFLTTFAYNDKYDSIDNFSYKDAIENAIDFLSKKVNEILTLEEIAAAVNISASRFSFIFKKKTGFSPIEYFNHLKVQKACQYLNFTDLRIKEISQDLGIDDPYYFSRMFAKVMGISPNEYRLKRNQ